MLGNSAMFAANTLLLLSAVPGYWRWRLAANNVGKTQQARLLSILKCNADTSFGRAHQFHSITSIAEYQNAVPLSTYADYEPYIQRLADGESAVLTRAPTVNLAPSSGSTAASKLIPYTSALKRDFQAGIAPWLYSAYLTRPGLLKGKHYWSVTPSCQERRFTPSGVPIGFQEDTEYFGAVKRRVMEALWAVPPVVHKIQDRTAFRYVTLLFLLSCRDLTLISVWNPTFFLLILDGLKTWVHQLVEDIGCGTLNIPGSLDSNLTEEITSLLKANPGRAAELDDLFKAADWILTKPVDKRRTLGEYIWPNLQMISCWADGPAQVQASQLRRCFPSIALQPKGLLATEGMVSFPLGNHDGAALALTSHFLEFLEPSAGGAPHLAHQLELGETYGIVLTTGGGLYRYQLGDLVQVTGFVRDCPLVRFVGRSDAVVDLFGEKLNETHVQKVGRQVFSTLSLNPAFWMLAPEMEGEHQGHYTLFIQVGLPDVHPEEVNALLEKLEDHFEAEFHKNFHYRYCRQLGQLTALRVFAIPVGCGDANQIFLTTCCELGLRLGDIKPSVLHWYTGWAGVFSSKGAAARSPG